MTKIVREPFYQNNIHNESDKRGELMKGSYLSEYQKLIPSFNNLTVIHTRLRRMKKRVAKFIRDAIPNRPVFQQEVESEVWKELSLIYYKYEDGYQKRAFREVLSEISDSINDGHWGTVYNKLYRFEQLSRNSPSMPSIDF
jgi:hypothetical protein